MKQSTQPKPVRRVMIVGGLGLLGQKIAELVRDETDWDLMLATRKFLVDGNGYEQFDSLSRADWKERLMTERWKPDVIINAAAMTSVDQCESNRREAWETNVELVEILASVCRAIDARLIQISTDYVFDGEGGPYSEEDSPSPINYYGKSKLAAENVFRRSGVRGALVRTMWLYGTTAQVPQPDGTLSPERLHFVDWIRNSLEGRTPIRVATDEFGTPTFIDDLAYGVVKIIDKNYEGLLHMAGSTRCSRLEWANAVAREFNLMSAAREFITPVLAEELGRVADRPLSSGLSNMKASSALDMKFLNLEDGLATYRVQWERRLMEMHD